MQYEVDLKWHEDDASGYWGLCHKKAVGKFNAFWSPDGIFHDVFEHYFEEEHPYFSGDAAYTIYGEMVASGHGIAYADMGIDNFRYRRGRPSRSYTIDTTDLLEDWVGGHTDYPDFPIDSELCKVPWQKPVDYSNSAGSWIAKYLDWYDEHVYHDRTRIKQIRKTDIESCYWWGYKRAKRIIGNDRDHSYNVLDKFLTQWHQITKSRGEEKPDFIIQHEDAYPINSFKFTVKTKPKLSVECVIVDDLHREWPLDLLITEF